MQERSNAIDNALELRLFLHWLTNMSFLAVSSTVMELPTLVGSQWWAVCCSVRRLPIRFRRMGHSRMFSILATVVGGKRCFWDPWTKVSKPCAITWRISKVIGLPDSKVRGANMGPIWRRQDPGRLHVSPMNFAICSCPVTSVRRHVVMYPPYKRQ